MKLAAFNKTKIKFCTTKKMKNTHTFAKYASVHGGMSAGGMEKYTDGRWELGVGPQPPNLRSQVIWNEGSQDVRMSGC